MTLQGRRVIYTDELEITKENITSVLDNAFITHLMNKNEIEYLYNYEKGNQPILERVKDVRPEINNLLVENHARAIIDFKVGYEAGSPIKLVQRNSKTNGTVSQDDDRISLLNEIFDECDKSAKDVELFRDFKICGVGYMMIVPKEKKDGLSPFDLLVLDPRTTFIIRTNDAYKKPLMAVAYSQLSNGNREITCYTENRIYEIGYHRKAGKQKYGEPEFFYENFVEKPNILGKIPVIEFVNNYERMGAFESVITLIDGLNVLTSDRVNDTEQFVSSLLWLHNCDIDDEQRNSLSDANGVIVTRSAGDGRDAKITYLTQTLNQSETQTFADDLYEQILAIAGVPNRKYSDGGSTGSAVLLSNGWQLAESSARSMELIFGRSEKALLSVALDVIKISDGVPTRLKELNPTDMTIKFSRNKTYDLVNRVNSLIGLINVGVDPNKAFQVTDIFDDSQEVAVESRERIDKLLFEKSGVVTESDIEDEIQPMPSATEVI